MRLLERFGLHERALADLVVPPSKVYPMRVAFPRDLSEVQILRLITRFCQKAHRHFPVVVVAKTIEIFGPIVMENISCKYLQCS